jgi:hypothetical protein
MPDGVGWPRLVRVQRFSSHYFLRRAFLMMASM